MLKKSTMASAVGAVVLAGLSLGVANAAENPFQAAGVAGVQLAEHGEGKCGEGKCGEGKCGADKKKEGKCGEGKCGEGKCGADKKGEGKCGEGKCGAKK